MRRRAILLIKQIFRSIYLLFIAISLSACTQSNLKDELQRYQQRLANVLDTTPVDTEFYPPVPYPAVSDLRTEVPEQIISLRVFYYLENCPAKTLIAQRNTALGRAQLPSQRLIYEKKLIKALEQCAENNENANEQLFEWLEVKKSNLPKVWANMLLLSEETKVSLSLPRAPLKQEDKQHYTDYKLAWQSLLDTEQLRETDQLETHLKFLRQTPMAAKVWQAQQVLEASLTSTTHWLSKQTEILSCKQPESGYLANVFQLYFVEKVQPIGNAINQFHYELTPVFKVLVNHQHLPSSFKIWLSKRHSQDFEKYQVALREHVSYWQTFFKTCGIKPGAASI